MLSDLQRDELRPLVRTMQIIVAALLLGVVNFAAIAVFIPMNGRQDAQNQAFLTYLAVGAAVCAIVALLIAPMVMLGPLRRSFSGDSQATGIRPIAQVYQTLLIIRAAILEGAIFFCLVSYMLERQAISLAAAGVLLLLLLAQFPTLSRVAAWVENELAVAEQTRYLR
jgi:hypothetical protein